MLKIKNWLMKIKNNNIKRCKYCNDYTQKVNEMSGKQAWFSIYEHYMEVIDDRKDGNIMSFKIKYCPMCGKNLRNGK